LEEFANKAGDKAKAFLDLCFGVLNYRTNLLKLIHDQQQEVKQKIAEIDVEIRKLEAELEESSGVLSAAWSAIKFGVTTGAAAVTTVAGVRPIASVASFTALAPIASVGRSDPWWAVWEHSDS